MLLHAIQQREQPPNAFFALLIIENGTGNTANVYVRLSMHAINIQ
jgi:hypothetical protein